MSMEERTRVHKRLAAAAWLRKAVEFAGPLAAERPLLIGKIGEGSEAAAVCFQWPGVLSVSDPVTGERLAESEPGKPDCLALSPDLVEPLPDVQAAITLPDQVRARLIERFRKLFDGRQREAFAVASLSESLEVIDVDIVAVGNENQVPVRTGDVARHAVLRDACSIVVAHNHPISDAMPSNSDVDVTTRLRLVMEVMGIPLLDHLIFSREDSHSMATGDKWGTTPHGLLAHINEPLPLASS